jgi:hypothetical protein
MDHHRISFLSYLLAPKPQTDYKDVGRKVMQNEKLEQAIQDTARDNLHQRQLTLPHKSRSKRTNQNELNGDDSNRISSEAIAVELSQRLNDTLTTSSAYTSAVESSSASEASSPLNCRPEPFRFDIENRSVDSSPEKTVDADDGDGSRGLTLSVNRDTNPSEDAIDATNPLRPRTAAALANYELQFAQLVAEQKQRATKLLRQMRTCISSLLLRLAGWVLIKVLCRLFNSVLYRPNELRLLKDTIRQQRAPLVFLPIHRSHLDYILISFVLYMKGVAPPLVAAGDNLNIPLFGTLMRGLGAFFIRRRMDPVAGERDIVYRSLLQAYVTENLKVNQNLEFFMEGARSRTGKLLLPKVSCICHLTKFNKTFFN